MTTQTMTARRTSRLAILGVALLTPLMLAGAALADDNPSHDGDPNQWGPPLAALCANPAAAAAAGYNVILGNGAANVIVGGPRSPTPSSRSAGTTPSPADLGLTCCASGAGTTRATVGSGNDAVFGEEDNDKLRGSAGTRLPRRRHADRQVRRRPAGRCCSRVRDRDQRPVTRTLQDPTVSGPPDPRRSDLPVGGDDRSRAGYCPDRRPAYEGRVGHDGEAPQ